MLRRPTVATGVEVMRSRRNPCSGEFSSVLVWRSGDLDTTLARGIASGGFAICQDDPGSGVISGFSGGIDPGCSRSQPLNDPAATAPAEQQPVVQPVGPP